MRMIYIDDYQIKTFVIFNQRKVFIIFVSFVDRDR